MWFALALFAGSLLLTSVLSPKPKQEKQRPRGLSEFNFPRSNEGDPVPIIFGTVKLTAPNTIWTGAFDTDQIKEKQKTGLFSSKKTTTGYQYHLGVDLALCLGPDIRLRKIWFGKDLVWEGLRSDGYEYTLLSISDDVGGWFTFYPGNYDQPQDPFLLYHIGENVPQYNGISHIVFSYTYPEYKKGYRWGTSPTIDAIAFEVQRLPNTLELEDGKHVMPNGLDCNPVEVLYCCLVEKWGKIGQDPGSFDIASFREAAYKVYDEGNGMSLKIDQPNKGSDIADEVLRQIDGILTEDPTSGKIRLKLIRADYDISTLPVLGPHNVIAVSNFTKKLWPDTFNQIRITFVNRENDYAEATTTEQDFSNINFQGKVRTSSASYPGVYVAETAQKIAARERGQLTVPLFSCDLEVNRQASILRPGDPFIFRWPPYNIGGMVMRVGKYDLGALVGGRIRFSATQDEFGSSEVTVVGSVPTQWEPPTVEPNDIEAIRLSEAPYLLGLFAGYTYVGGDALFVALPTTPVNESSTFDAWATDDGDFSSAVEALHEAAYPGKATLFTTYSKQHGFTSGYDPGSIMIFALDGAAVPVNSNEYGIRSGDNLLLIDDEIIAFTSSSYNGDGTYTLSGIYRGLFDTAPADHGEGASVYFLSSEVVGESPHVGTDTISVKLIDRTPFGTSDIADAITTDITFNRRADRPLPVDYVTVGEAVGYEAEAETGITVPVEFRYRSKSLWRIGFASDPSEDIDAGNTYRLRWRLDNGPWNTIANVTSPYHLPVDLSTGMLDVEITTINNGLESYTSAVARVNLTLNATLVSMDLDGTLVTVDDQDTLWEL